MNVKLAKRPIKAINISKHEMKILEHAKSVVWFFFCLFGLVFSSRSFADFTLSGLPEFDLSRTIFGPFVGLSAGIAENFIQSDTNSASSPWVISNPSNQCKDPPDPASFNSPLLNLCSQRPYQSHAYSWNATMAASLTTIIGYEVLYHHYLMDLRLSYSFSKELLSAESTNTTKNPLDGLNEPNLCQQNPLRKPYNCYFFVDGFNYDVKRTVNKFLEIMADLGYVTEKEIAIYLRGGIAIYQYRVSITTSTPCSVDDEGCVPLGQNVYLYNAPTGGPISSSSLVLGGGVRNYMDSHYALDWSILYYLNISKPKFSTDVKYELPRQSSNETNDSAYQNYNTHGNDKVGIFTLAVGLNYYFHT